MTIRSIVRTVLFCSAAALALPIVGGNDAKADFITTNSALPPINGGINGLVPAYLTPGRYPVRCIEVIHARWHR